MIGAIIIAYACESLLAGTTEDSVSDSVYIAYGDQFASHTRRVDVVEPSGKLAIGTCVVFAPRLAMTAAHVVDNAMTVAVSGNPVTTVFVHPEFDPTKMGWHDIAILRCKGDFGLAFYPPLSTEPEKLGVTCLLAGYGATGPISSGYVRSDGLLRAGTNTIKAFERTLIVCGINRHSSPLEFGIAPGDSGGPLFVGSGSSARVSGIHSFTMRVGRGPVRSREGEESGHTQVSLYVDWISQVKEMAR